MGQKEWKVCVVKGERGQVKGSVMELKGEGIGGNGPEGVGG